MLTLLDEYTGETLSATAATKIGSALGPETLYQLLIKRYKPDVLRSDYGAEFTFNAIPNLSNDDSADHFVARDNEE